MMDDFQSDLDVYDNIQDAQVARIKEWEGRSSAQRGFPLTFYANELFGEAGEAANVIKKLHREELGVPGSRDTKEHLAEELADVMICLRNIAIKLAIDIDKSAEGLEVRPPLTKSATLSDAGCDLAYRIGDVCELIAYAPNALMLGTYLAVAMHRVRELSHIADIDIDRAVVNKFNDASIKNGLSTRVSVTLEETFL